MKIDEHLHRVYIILEKKKKEKKEFTSTPFRKPISSQAKGFKAIKKEKKKAWKPSDSFNPANIPPPTPASPTCPESLDKAELASARRASRLRICEAYHSWTTLPINPLNSRVAPQSRQIKTRFQLRRCFEYKDKRRKKKKGKKTKKKEGKVTTKRR